MKLLGILLVVVILFAMDEMVYALNDDDYHPGNSVDYDQPTTTTTLPTLNTTNMTRPTSHHETTTSDVTRQNSTTLKQSNSVSKMATDTNSKLWLMILVVINRMCS